MRKFVPIILGVFILCFTSTNSFAWGSDGCVRFDLLCKLTGKGAVNSESSNDKILGRETVFKKNKDLTPEEQNEGITRSTKGYKVYKGRKLKENGCVMFDVLCDLTGKGAINTKIIKISKKEEEKNYSERTKRLFAEKHDTEVNSYGGMFDWSDPKQHSLLFGMQHQSDELYRESFLGTMSPITGGFITENSAFYIYSGVQWEYDAGPIRITPSFAPGYYNAGDGKDLGYPLEFKTELQFTFDLPKGAEMGMSYNHISNASLGSKNPGANSYMLNFLKQF